MRRRLGQGRSSSGHTYGADVPTEPNTERIRTYYERFAPRYDRSIKFWERVLSMPQGRYVSHYTEERPHRAFVSWRHRADGASSATGPTAHVRRRDVLGGLIHEYRWAVCRGLQATSQRVGTSP